MRQTILAKIKNYKIIKFIGQSMHFFEKIYFNCKYVMAAIVGQ